MQSQLLYQYNRLRFFKFQREVHPQTWKNHPSLLAWAAKMSKKDALLETKQLFLESSDPIVRQGYLLREQLKKSFYHKYYKTHLRILIHVPPAQLSPAGYSLFNNLLQGLAFLGIPVKALEWRQDLHSILKSFKPNIFLSSDSKLFLDQIDWQVIQDYRRKEELLFGLTASIKEYGNTSLEERLKWAKEHHLDFYYSFRSAEYLRTRTSYRPFFKHGYQILTVEFGANPLLYYPLPNISRDIPYIFLASNNVDKWARYFEYLPKVINHYPGFIDGPGWRGITNWAAPPIHRFLYARAQVGLNLHIQDSIDWANELNERTYILAACGVPQLMDHPKLLSARFSNKCFFVADSSLEYQELFSYVRENKNIAQKRSLQALKEVYSKHTSFHRAESFHKQLQTLIK